MNTLLIITLAAAIFIVAFLVAALTIDRFIAWQMRRHSKALETIWQEAHQAPRIVLQHSGAIEVCVRKRAA